MQELEQIDGKARQLLYGLVFLLHCLALQIQQTLAGFRFRVKAWQSACVFASVFNASSTNPCRILGLICRKDMLSAQDDQEWQATALSQSLTGEGPLAGAEKKKLNLEEERKVQWGSSFELCHLSLSLRQNS